MKTSLTYFIFSIFLTLNAYSVDQLRGRVAIFSDSSPSPVEVILPKFSGGILQNKLVHFTKLPTDLNPDGNGCFCYDINDDRFAFVHAYYYASQELEYYNKIFSKLGLPHLDNLEINLTRNEAIPTTGYTTLTTSTLTYSRPAFDLTILAHEIGHFIHFRAAGQDHFGTSDGLETMDGIQNLGVIEGTANLLSALFTGITKIGSIDGFDWNFDINKFIRFPDVLISQLDSMEQVFRSPVFSAYYPQFIQKAHERVGQIKASPDLLNYYNLPSPYASSAVINQPLWNASLQFGKDDILFLYIKTLSELKSFSAYSDLANGLLKNVKNVNSPLYLMLKSEYQRRGLAITE